MARLPDYFRALTDFIRQDIDTVSSGELAAAAGVNAAQLRRDLSYLGSHGVRGVGYDAAHLAAEIGRRLGVGRNRPVVIVGAGRLGQALTGYPGLAEAGFRITALLDRDPRVIGSKVGELRVRDVRDLATVVAEQGGAIGVIATSAEGAQQACDAFVAAGVTSVLTFAHGHLQVPAGVLVRQVDVATELSVLAFHTLAQLPGEDAGRTGVIDPPAVPTKAGGATTAGGATGAAEPGGATGSAVMTTLETERQVAR